VRFYQESRRSRIVQSAIFILLAVAAVFELLHGHSWRAGLLLVLSAVLLRSVWTRYWEIEAGGMLRHKAYGFDRSFSAAGVCYAGPVRRDAGFPVSKDDIELELKGQRAVQYVRVADGTAFLTNLRLVSPQAEIVMM
jgi:hypothetical protein